jgi:hypothetical protein
MTVIFQIKEMSALDEISHWLTQRKIVIQKVVTRKIGADNFFKNIRRYQINLPKDYQFNREEANER